MTNIIQFPNVKRGQGSDGYWGLCPKCRKNDGYVNVGDENWFFCKEHKLKWLEGNNLFSHDSEEEEQARLYELGWDGFRETEALHPRPNKASGF